MSQELIECFGLLFAGLAPAAFFERALGPLQRHSDPARPAAASGFVAERGAPRARPSPGLGEGGSGCEA